MNNIIKSHFLSDFNIRKHVDMLQQRYCFSCSGIRMFDPSLESIQNFITSLNEKVSELSDNNIENAIEENALTLDLALVYDAVTLFVSTLNTMELEEGSNVTCDGEESWTFGSSIVNYVRTVSTFFKVLYH